MKTFSLDIKRDAVFSGPCFRAVLRRSWDTYRPKIGFIGLNPGKADAFWDDVTARKMVGFSLRWGYGSYQAFNLFQFVATNPKKLVDRAKIGAALNPTDADRYIVEALGKLDAVCLAWGNEPAGMSDLWYSRVEKISDILIKAKTTVVCAAVNMGGRPTHLSRLGYTKAPIPWWKP